MGLDAKPLENSRKLKRNVSTPDDCNLHVTPKDPVSKEAHHTPGGETPIEAPVCLARQPLQGAHLFGTLCQLQRLVRGDRVLRARDVKPLTGASHRDDNVLCL